MKSINEIQRVGNEQADQFMKERLVIKAQDIDAPIQNIVFFFWKYNLS